MPGSYEHFIYAGTSETLDKVSAELAAAGYLIPNPPELTCTETLRQQLGEQTAPTGCTCEYHMLLTAYGPLEKAMDQGGDDDIWTACERHGATYYGGSTLILP
jgi:hypothetical protein